MSGSTELAITQGMVGKTISGVTHPVIEPDTFDVRHDTVRLHFTDGTSTDLTFSATTRTDLTTVTTRRPK